MKRFFAAAICAFACTSTAGAAVGNPQGGGANNVVIALATGEDGTTREHSNIQAVPVASDTVASTNLALAMSVNCTGCHSAAVAVQVLIVFGSPSVFVPANVASATNGGCTACAAYAYAWQDVVQEPGPAYLSPTARMEIAQLRQQISDDVAAGAPWTPAAADALTDQLDALTAQLEAVVESEVVLAGGSPGAPPDRSVQSASD